MYNLDFLFTSLVYGNATFNNISVICGSQYYWWRKPGVHGENLFFLFTLQQISENKCIPIWISKHKKNY